MSYKCYLVADWPKLWCLPVICQNPGKAYHVCRLHGQPRKPWIDWCPRGRARARQPCTRVMRRPAQGCRRDRRPAFSKPGALCANLQLGADAGVQIDICRRTFASNFLVLTATYGDGDAGDGDAAYARPSLGRGLCPACVLCSNSFPPRRRALLVPFRQPAGQLMGRSESAPQDLATACARSPPWHRLSSANRAGARSSRLPQGVISARLAGVDLRRTVACRAPDLGAQQPSGGHLKLWSPRNRASAHRCHRREAVLEPPSCCFEDSSTARFADPCWRASIA